jgi:hypothetical protein
MKKTLFLASLFMIPAMASAATFSSVTDLINFFTGLIYSSVVPLLIGLALVVFFWGLVVFIQKSDSAAEQEKGRSMMLWGIIALFVMFSVWGLVGILASTFGLRVCLPGAPGSGCNSSSSSFDTRTADPCLLKNDGPCL